MTDIITPLDELRLGSIQFVDLMVRPEKEYNLVFDTEKLSTSEFNFMKDIDEYIKYIKEKKE